MAKVHGVDCGLVPTELALEAEEAASFGPFVVLLGEDGADEAGDGVAVGEDPDDVGAAADLPVQPFLRVVGPDLAPDGFGEARVSHSRRR